MSREQQQTSSQQQRDEANVSTSTQQLPFESIDDMQEKYLKTMPAFKQLHLDETTEKADDLGLEWIGDTLQVTEFMQTFGDKLKEAQNMDTSNSDANSANNGDGENCVENNDHAAILTNIEAFRMGLQNKNEKLRKEVTNLVQFLLKAVICNSFTADSSDETGANVAADSSNLKEESFDAQNESSVDKTDELEHTNTELDDLCMIKRLNALECTELTFSELLRLYFLRCLNNMRVRRAKQENQKLQFGIDVTVTFYEKLKLYTSLLSVKSFDQLEASVKASMMAYLCDELLTTTNYELEEEYSNANAASNCANASANAGNSVNGLNGAVNGSVVNASEFSNQDGVIVKDLEQTIEELNQVRLEIDLDFLKEIINFKLCSFFNRCDFMI